MLGVNRRKDVPHTRTEIRKGLCDICNGPLTVRHMIWKCPKGCREVADTYTAGLPKAEYERIMYGPLHVPRIGRRSTPVFASRPAKVVMLEKRPAPEKRRRDDWAAFFK